MKKKLQLNKKTIASFDASQISGGANGPTTDTIVNPTQQPNTGCADPSQHFFCSELGNTTCYPETEQNSICVCYESNDVKGCDVRETV